MYSTGELSMEQFRKAQQDFERECLYAESEFSEKMKEYQSIKKKNSKDNRIAILQEREAKLKNEIGDLKSETNNCNLKLKNQKSDVDDLYSTSRTLTHAIKEKKKQYCLEMSKCMNGFWLEIKTMNDLNNSQREFEIKVIKINEEIERHDKEIAEAKKILQELYGDLKQLSDNMLNVSIDVEN